MTLDNFVYARCLFAGVALAAAGGAWHRSRWTTTFALFVLMFANLFLSLTDLIVLECRR